MNPSGSAVVDESLLPGSAKVELKPVCETCDMVRNVDRSPCCASIKPVSEARASF